MDLTKDEAYAVADFIDTSLIDMIRNDTDLDSMCWLVNITSAYQKLCAFSGYEGMTDERKI
ncbi:MAG: hypothetical protein IKM73_00175 [Acidaminococcaceae bacterium]|nr:hypothetical protein [Acidaminococcaceae bacterium]